MAALSRFGAVARPLTRRLLGLVSRQAYGSASASQLQYYDYEEEEEWDRREPKPMVDAEGWLPPRGVQWVVIGDRGAKKHVYAERLSKLLEVPHISMGTLVRQELNPRSSLYKKVQNYFSFALISFENFISFFLNCVFYRSLYFVCGSEFENQTEN